MVKNVLFAIYLGLSLIVISPLLVVVKFMELLGKEKAKDKYVEKITRRWAKAVLWATGTTVKITGQENIPPNMPVVFISNHQSYFDILAFLGYVPGEKSFIAKIETQKVPLFSTWMRKIHCVFMDRKNLKQSFEAIKKGIENLKHGYSVVIFPEGTRSRKADMGEFKPGSFKLATRTGLPVIPVTMRNTYKIWEEKRRIRRAQIEIVVSKPISTSSMTREDMIALPSKVHSIIMNNLCSAIPEIV